MLKLKSFICSFVIFLFLFINISFALSAPQIQTQHVKNIAGAEEIIDEESKEVKRLRKEIKQREEIINADREEIKKINSELEAVSEKRKNLQEEYEFIKLINNRNKKEIDLINNTIYFTRLKLKTLKSDISINEINSDILSKILRKMYKLNNEIELRGIKPIYFNIKGDFFELIKKINEENKITTTIYKQTSTLYSTNRVLTTTKIQTENERANLLSLQKELGDRQKILQVSLNKQSELFNETKNSELEYQKLLKEKLENRISLAKEVVAYESQLEFTLDPTKIPDARPGVLGWPIEQKFRVTQEFGRTAFAVKNAHRYGRAFHAGIDIATPHGTKIISPAGGEVIGIGDTDTIVSCQSFGKWVAVRHFNGLTSLSAHLSLVKVRIGELVSQKDLLGYSGNSGFSTGSHLHFAVYSSDGINIVPYESISSNKRCAGQLIPIAADDSRINPRDYLDTAF